MTRSTPHNPFEESGKHHNTPSHSGEVTTLCRQLQDAVEALTSILGMAASEGSDAVPPNARSHTLLLAGKLIGDAQVNLVMLSSFDWFPYLAGLPMASTSIPGTCTPLLFQPPPLRPPPPSPPFLTLFRPSCLVLVRHAAQPLSGFQIALHEWLGKWHKI